MVVAGIDVGGKNVHIVIMDDGKVPAKGMAPTGIKKAEATANLYDSLLKQAGLTQDQVQTVVATGSSGSRATFANGFIPDAADDARAVAKMYRTVRTVIDVGAEEGRAIKVGPDGNVKDFAINEKCAAGTGRGMEVFANLIMVPVWEIGERSFKIEKKPPMISSTCVVFAKSEVVSLLEEGKPENEIMAAYCSAMSHRIMELLNRLGVKEKFVITGGIAKNMGVVSRLEKELGVKTAELKWANPQYIEHGYSFDTQIAGAIGAALFGNVLIKTGRAKSARKI